MRIHIENVYVKPMKSDGNYAMEFVAKGRNIPTTWWEGYPPTMDYVEMLKRAYLKTNRPLTSLGVYGQEGDSSVLAILLTFEDMEFYWNKTEDHWDKILESAVKEALYVNREEARSISEEADKYILVKRQIALLRILYPDREDTSLFLEAAVTLEVK